MNSILSDAQNEILEGLYIIEEDRSIENKNEMALGLLETVAFSLLIQLLEEVEENEIGEKLAGNYSNNIGGLLANYGLDSCPNRHTYSNYIMDKL